MIIFVELQTTKEEEPQISQSSEIQDEYDYYTKFRPLKNKVIKYEF